MRETMGEERKKERKRERGGILINVKKDMEVWREKGKARRGRTDYDKEGENKRGGLEDLRNVC